MKFYKFNKKSSGVLPLSFLKFEQIFKPENKINLLEKKFDSKLHQTAKFPVIGFYKSMSKLDL
jgi:hypothetical protein